MYFELSQTLLMVCFVVGLLVGLGCGVMLLLRPKTLHLLIFYSIMMSVGWLLFIQSLVMYGFVLGVY